MPETILVAEDDPEARALLTQWLSSHYRVLEAADGVEALDILHREVPDLIITDIVMPRMDGYELVRRARQNERTRQVPIIFCSACYHEREVREMGHTLGVGHTLGKPYDWDTVQKTVAEVLALRAAAIAAPGQRAVRRAQAERLLREAQERLNAMVAFSCKLFSQKDKRSMALYACDAAREILLAQCAEVFLSEDDHGEATVAGGLAEADVARLFSAEPYRQLCAQVQSGGAIRFPETDSAAQVDASRLAPGDFASMLGVPIASASRQYGHICVLNRIGRATFNEEDLDIARAIAAQLAVAYESVLCRRELESEIARRSIMEEEVRRLNRDLEARVAERTAELELANRELETFSYSVAHDLRAPLRLIDAQVQMLLEGGMGQLPRAVVVQLEQVRRGAEHMSALIDGLLSLAKVRHVEMHKRSVPFDALVSRAIGILSNDAQGRAVEWRVHPLPVVECDEEMMLQVCLNVIGNALKYTRPRAPAIIEIGFERTPEPHIYVRDNGVGFDMRYASKLFAPFQRLHRQDEFEGTGVGLATVSRILERHGGRIWAEATLGKGAVFRFSLPGM